MWGYESVQARFMTLFAAMLALPALAGEPAPAPQSDDPLIAAALRYEYGEGVARNSSRAAEMYCAAAHQGNADAAYRLGWMYAEGNGIARDDRHAAALFQRAASLGHGSALRMLEGTQMSDARMPLCITLAPPPPIAVESDADGKPLVQEKSVAARTAAAPAVTAARSTPPPAPEASPSASDQIAFAIAHWASAWSRREVDRYLAAYAPDFQPPRGESRQQWEHQRRARITARAWIEIRIRDLAVAVEGDLAQARFVQDYRSDKGRESVMKTLMLVKPERTWLIQQEQSETLPPAALTR